MQASVSPPLAGETPKDSKASGKNKWRGKLFSSEGRRKTSDDQESRNNDVDTFLRGPGTKPERRFEEQAEVDRIEHTPPARAEIRPQENHDIDRFLHQHPSPRAEARPVARSGLPGLAIRPSLPNHQGLPIAPTESDLGPIKDTYWRAKPRANKGLRVNFVSEAPLIIGEGGDEADLPSREISRSLTQLSVSASTQPLSLRRRSTGFSSPSKSNLPAVQSQYVHVQDVNSNELLLANTQNHKPPEEPQVFVRDAPEQAALFASELSQTNPFSDPATNRTDRAVPPQPRSESLDVAYPEPAVHTGNSLTPVPSPLPLKLTEKSPQHYGFPNIAVKAGSPSTSTEKIDKSQEKYSEKGRAGSAPEIKPFSLRSVAKALGHDALDEFDERVRGLFSLFRLGVGVHGDPMSLAFSSWMRIAAWWFLKGRMELESAVRSKAKSAQGSNERIMPRSLMQAYVDLAKAWWIVDEITPGHPEIKKYGSQSMNSMVAIIENFGNKSLAEQVEVHVAIIANMRALTMSMKRNSRLPPQPFEIQGLDSNVLLDSPPLQPDAANLVSGLGKEASDNSACFTMLIGDTPRHFSLGRMFSKLSLISRHTGKEDAKMPCLISIVQGREDGDFGALIATQDSQVNIFIRSEKTRRSDLTWRLIRWNNETHTMGLPLSRELDLAMELSEKDYKILWSMCDHNQNIQKKFGPEENESLVYECALHHFERLEMPNEPGGFPQGSIKDCRMRLFSRKLIISGGTGQKALHDGFRLMVLTGPSVKTTRFVRSDLSGEKLILFAPHRRSADGPCLTVRMPGFPSLLFGFHKQEELDAFRLVASGDAITQEDHAFPPLPLRGFNVTIHPLDEDQESQCVSTLRWRQLQPVEKRRLHPDQSADSSDGLRFLADCDYGSFVDRVNLGPGELKLGLGVEDYNEVKLLRPPQPDITWSLEDRLQRDAVATIGRKLQGMAHVHQFQALVTGFSVRYDGHASSFSISRRRMVVPIYKKWEATSVRLQVLQQDKIVQLAAFFKDFHHGSCMNFVLKTTEVFETSNKSGIFLLRIADAKFALAKTEADPEKDFLCLDVPEYPSEHDDINIGFDSEEERDKFVSCLPATVSKASRLGSLRR